ncbi:hypothetical protein CC80DRAFT_552908 [Byssothecium circinans]|uniref:Uncharacterized protein n=1 Tax=Byssothecium circinans TaxID=147558 RepID=A0A6A5TG90_9PLEO|nr:hypothetical protein CC80DRAFT_552908 [Byssothecium circinans]
MSVNADLAARPPRIPKLTYRNPCPVEDSTPTPSSPQTPTDAAVSGPFAVQRTPTSTTDSAEPSIRPRSFASSSASSLASSNDSASKGSKTSSTKKKKNAMLGFLTMKEPSLAALEQFAKSQSEQLASKSASSANTVGLQYIAAQKLPSNVPKVNSKWDGIPEAVKSARHSTSSTKRTSSSSQRERPTHIHGSALNTSAYSVASNVSRGPPPSFASAVDVSERQHLDPLENPPPNSPSETSLPEMTCFFDDDSAMMSGALPAPETGLKPGPAPMYPWSPPAPPSGVDVGDTSPFPETKTEEPMDEGVDTKADAILKRLRGNQGFLAGEATEVKLPGETDDRDAVPDTHGFLFGFESAEEPRTRSMSSSTSTSSISSSIVLTPSAPSPAQDPQFVDWQARTSPNNFSRPRPFQIASFQPASSVLPTLYEVSIASTETVTEATASTSPRNSIDTVSVIESVAESLTPSEMSASWYRSPKERLGLGSRVSKSAALPWENLPEQGKPKRGRLFFSGKHT